MISVSVLQFSLMISAIFVGVPAAFLIGIMVGIGLSANRVQHRRFRAPR